jgi:hypothetical protein
MSENSNEPKNPQTTPVTLDGAQVSRQELQEKKDHTESGKKIVEIQENTFKTLNRLRG